MAILKQVLEYILELYLLLLIGTMIISWIRAFARDWHPTGVVLVIWQSSWGCSIRSFRKEKGTGSSSPG